MSKDCLSQAFAEVGVDYFKGLEPDEAARIKGEFAALMDIQGKKFEDLTDSEKELISSGVKGMLINKVDHEIKIREQSLIVKQKAGKEGLKYVEDLLINSGDVSSVHFQEQAVRMDLLTHFDKIVDASKEARSLLKQITNPLNKDLHDQVHKALHMISKGADDEAIIKAGLPKEALTGAKGIADALIETQNLAWYKKRNAGIMQGKIDKYLYKQSYNSQKVRDFGKPKFVDFLEANLDIKEVFSKGTLAFPSSVKERKAVYERIFDALVSGKESNAEDPVSAMLAGLSKKRELIWKDGEASFQAQKMFALEDNLLSIVNREVDKAAKQTAVRSTLGAFPKTFTDQLSVVARDNAFLGEKALSELEVTNKTNNIKALTAMVTEPPIYDQGTTAAIVKMVSTAQMLKLGSMAIAQMPMDMISTARTLMAQRNTLNAFSAMYTAAKSWGSLLKNNIDPDVTLRAMGLIQDLGTMGISGRYDLDASVAQRSGKLSNYVQYGVNKFLQTTGANHVNNINRAVIAMETQQTIMEAIEAIGKGFKNVDDDFTKKAFTDIVQNMGLTTKEVSILSGNIDKLKGFGPDLGHLNDAINIDAIHKLDADAFVPGTNDLISKVGKYSSLADVPDDLKASYKQLQTNAALINKMKDSMHRKVKGYAIGQINKGVPVANPRYRMQRAFGASTGSINQVQQVVGLMATFKNTILAMTNQTIHDFTKLSQARGTLNTAAFGAGSLGLASFSYYMAMDLISSAILNKESSAEKFLEGNYQGALTSFANKASLMPFVTDPMIKVMYGGYGAKDTIKDFVAGPVGATAGEIIRGAQGDNKVEDLGKVLLRNMGTNHWILDSAGRWLGQDIKNMGKIKPGSEF